MNSALLIESARLPKWENMHEYFAAYLNGSYRTQAHFHRFNCAIYTTEKVEEFDSGKYSLNEDI